MPATSSTSASEPARAAPTRRQVTVALALVALALVVSDQVYGYVHDRMFAASSFNPAARVQQAAPDTLVIGASGAHYALDPAVLGGRTYNAAEDGQSGFYVASLLNVLPAGSIRRVIYGFDPGDVASGLDGPNVKHLLRFAPFVKYDPVFERWATGGRLLARLKLQSGYYRYRGIAATTQRRWHKPQWRGTGFAALEGTMAPRALPVPETLPAVMPAASGLEMLEAVAAAVRRHQAELVVVVPPMYGEDRGALPHNAAIMQAMRDRFAGLKLCDLTLAPAAAFADIFENRLYYRDGAHTNGAGARAYSDIIRSLIAERCFR
jgi:hypothetical protein